MTGVDHLLVELSCRAAGGSSKRSAAADSASASCSTASGWTWSKNRLRTLARCTGHADFNLVMPRGSASLLEDKVVIDPSNPIGIENGQMIRTLPDGQSASDIVAGLLPASAHYVKGFGSLAATDLASHDNREQRVVLFYATDDDSAGRTIERLIRATGFEPLKVGGVADAWRIEAPSGDLQGAVLDLAQARVALATKETSA